MDEERRREVGLFRYALIRDAADPSLSKASAVGWSARSLARSISGLTAGRSGSRAERWMSGFARIAVAGSTRWYRGRGGCAAHTGGGVGAGVRAQARAVR